MKTILISLCSLLILFNSYEAFARTKPKKVREKDHPNYQRYQSDEEFREGKSKRLTGILLSSIGGGTGAAAFIAGVLWNSCFGASEKELPTCKKNARNTMVAGAIVGGASLGFGIPMISVGGLKMGDARRRIDEKYPVSDEKDDEGNEAFFGRHASDLVAKNRPYYEDLSLSLRVLNIEF